MSVETVYLRGGLSTQIDDGSASSLTVTVKSGAVTVQPAAVSLAAGQSWVGSGGGAAVILQASTSAVCEVSAPDRPTSLVLPSSPSPDGLLQFDASLGRYVDAVPAGELASVYNESTNVQTITSSTSIVTAATLLVPVCARPVWVNVEAACGQSVAGAGLAMLSLYDVTAGGAGTLLANFFTPLPNLTALGASSKFFAVRGQHRLGPVATPKLLTLKAVTLEDSASTAAFQILNGSASTYGTTFAAEAR